MTIEEVIIDYQEGNRNFQKTDLSGESIQDYDDKYEAPSYKKINLSNINLKEAKLEETNLEGVILKNAIFEGANLREADFFECDLEGADFRSANLKGAYLEDANLSQAIYNIQTVFPEEFDPKKKGMKKKR